MIGGEIEIDPAYVPPPQGASLAELFLLLPGRHASFGTAREAVRWWIEQLKPRGTMLLPAYCCSAVVQPFREAGVPCRFYPVNSQLQVDLVALRPLLDAAAAIQVIHYFGFPAADEVFKLGIPVLEDAVQALLDPDRRAQGDWAIASLRKFLPVPDGAFLWSRQPFVSPDLPAARGGLYGRKLFFRMLKHAAVCQQDTVSWWRANDGLIATEDALAAPVTPQGLSELTRETLRGSDLRAIAHRRRANYETLYAKLFGQPPSADPDAPSPMANRSTQQLSSPATALIKPLFAALPPGVIPYGLPILCAERAALKNHLQEHGIYPVVHWELPDEISREAFPDAWWLSERILTLPVDQRYGQPEMAYIADAIAAFPG
ncbi:MAG: DegT/DnrJ/EryC1/StrS aminotransferase family protein [Cyanobacteria bacterium NC_groundwater_1444_Ag_S-0.65um_54_12]|nr:DegT/DnrJ/EryC1/StrS aminotransferase family protein [Cyanobacteria bacterium NC_groundwater_1444_Ag_S-0.65um_54_12]